MLRNKLRHDPVLASSARLYLGKWWKFSGGDLETLGFRPDHATPRSHQNTQNRGAHSPRLAATLGHPGEWEKARAVRALFEEEIAAFNGHCRDGRGGAVEKGCRSGHRARQLTGTFGTVTVSVPRARIEHEEGKITEWRSKALPRYQRLTNEAEARVASVFSPGNQHAAGETGATVCSKQRRDANEGGLFGVRLKQRCAQRK